MNQARRTHWTRAGAGDCHEGLRSYRLVGFREATQGLRADHGAHLLPPPRSPLAAAELRLAGLRSLPELPAAAEIPPVLAAEAGRAAALGDGRALAADPSGGNAHPRRRVPPPLSDRASRPAEH